MAKEKTKRGKWITQQVEKLGLTLPEFADSIGMDRAAFWKLLRNDNCRLDSLNKILKGLGYDLTVTKGDKTIKLK